MNPVIYEMIIFDWDGTAVPDRHAPIGDLKAALEQILKEGGQCAIVTGTNLDNILKQGIADLSPLAKHGLHICTNRGSEIFDFDPEGRPELIFRRQATHAENRALDLAAIQLHDRIKAQGMRTEITFDRLNRRKVDLIPEPDWTSPKKAQFRELLSAVEERMHSAGIVGGIPGLITLSQGISRQAGLPNPKITSDIKHIEIGLTDKGDAASWITKALIEPSRIPLSLVSVWGDELGSLGSLPGSDALMRVPELTDAAFFSVGVEPEGVPTWVHSLGGGPKRFIEFLFEQAQLRKERREIPSLSPSEDLTWVLKQDGFDPSRERLMETLFAISNGNLGVRGASDLPVPAAQADLFVAGIYDQLVPNQPYSESDLFDSSGASRSTETEIVPLPFPFHFRAKIDGSPIHAGNVTRLEHRRSLDFKKGIYFEHNLVESSHGQKTKLSSFRLSSHADPHLLIQTVVITSENYSGHIDVDLSLCPGELEELYPHLTRLDQKKAALSTAQADLEEFQTIGSKDVISMASRISVNGRELKCSRISTDVRPGDTLVIERRISVFWSGKPGEASTRALAHSKSLPLNLSPNIEEHLDQWTRFWSDSDLALPQAPGPTDALRFSLYHLRSSAALASQSSIPAKALTGRGYEGHIFWDTEIFIFPFFLYTAPDIARQLLLYRYRHSPGARARAASSGFRGASYAWESTVTGKDVTPSFVSISGKDPPTRSSSRFKNPDLHRPGGIACYSRHRLGGIQILGCHTRS